MTGAWMQSTVPVLLVSFWGILGPFLQPGPRHAREAKQSYDRGRWEEAMDRFGRAREEDPDPALDFDLGAAAYRAGKYNVAEAAFAAGARAGRVAPGVSAYNRGNALYRGGDLQGALAAYREALRADPGNQDARYNYELTLRRLQLERKQGSQGQGGGQQQNAENRQESSKQQGGEEKRNQQQEGASGENQEQPAASDSSRAQPARPDSMQAPPDSIQATPAGLDSTAARPDSLLSRRQALQLLNQVTPEERELLKARLKPSHRRRPEKDW